ncbi:hypothetical protein C0989_008966 [Termitomyces sp. Mn162]|nr:hypothetical protein C0989_008966 [Termitomyces sp. Mn162]
MVLVLNFEGQELAGALSREGVQGILLKKVNMEDQDLEGAKPLVVKLDGGSPGLEVVLVEPYQSAGSPVRSGVTLGVGVLGVGLVGSVDFVLEKPVEIPEVFGNFVSDMGEDIIE